VSPPPDDPDRDAILARRHRLVALALSGLLSAPLGACDERVADPGACLSVVRELPPSPPPEPRLLPPSGEPMPCLSEAIVEPPPDPPPRAEGPNEDDGDPTPAPRPCLSVQRVTPPTHPAPCLSVERVIPPAPPPPVEPTPCLSVRSSPVEDPGEPSSF
jgi:hypothetical protein